MNANTEKRFWARVQMGLFCWDWLGALSQGYGHQEVAGSRTKAHRLSWVIHFGPIPDGLCVLHRCDNPRCVNPAHLFLGTQADNIQDMMAKDRGRWPVRSGEDANNARLTAAQVRTIRERVAAGETRGSLARELGVHKTTVAKIVSGKLWATVPMAATQNSGKKKGGK